MTSSADLPEGFLAEVFRNGCQCDHCVKWRAEIARLREAINYQVQARKAYISVDHFQDPLAGSIAAEILDKADAALEEIAREGK